MRMVIAGAGGGVGASLAFNLLLSPLDGEVVMLDERQNMVYSHLSDLEQSTCATTPRSWRRCSTGCLRGWPGTVILATNPVDPLGTWPQRRTGLERTRLLGYTLNDSLRLRTGIGRVLGVAPGRVQAWMVGEHGDLAVPLWDRVVLGGAAVALDDAQRAAVMEFVSGWYARHVALHDPAHQRSSTWTSGLGIARMVRACLDPAGDELWPASIMLCGEYGLEGVSLSVPVRLGGGGGREIEEWELSGEERDRLDEAARWVRDAADGL